MKITTVNTLNLEKLYEVCVKKINEGTENQKFGANIYELFNNIEISFALEEVSMMDAFFLKQISSKCSPLFDTTLDYSNMDLDASVRRYATFVNDILEDKSITDKDKFDYPYLYGPAILIRGSIVISLTGSRLLPLLSEDPSNFFIQATGGTCINNVSGPFTFKEGFDINNTNISAFLAKSFLDFFRRSMNSNLGVTDVSSDTGLYMYFIQHENLVQLATLRHPYLNIDFRTSKPEEWKKDVEAFKKLLSSTNKSILKKYELELVEFEVSCYTRLSTLFCLYEVLPKRFFTVIEDMRIPYGFKEIYIPASYPEKIASKLLSKYEGMQISIDSLESPYDKISHNYLNSKISFTLKLALEDINLYINEIILKNKSLTKEAKEVLEGIMKLSKGIYKTTYIK